MMEKVIKELLRVKKIDHPWAYFKGQYRVLISFWKTKGIEVSIITLQKVSQMLDVTPKFLIRIYKYDKFEEME